MSFSTDARVVRDRTRGLAEREAALARCVARFRPFGLLGTFAYLDRHAGPGDPSEKLVTAVDILDRGHAAWRDELGRFGQRRKAAKAEGLRRVTQAEIEPYAAFGWPGDLTDETAGRPLDLGFLRACGLALGKPEPVNLRRRLRRSGRVMQPAPRFDGCLPGCLIVVEALLAVLAEVIFDPPPIFWYGYGGTAVGALAISVIAGIRQVATQRSRHRSTAEAADRHRRELTERLRRAERAEAPIDGPGSAHPIRPRSRP